MPAIRATGLPKMLARTLESPAAVDAGMCAVAAVVAGGIERLGLGAEHGSIGLEHLARAEQLVVAGERLVVRVVGGIAEVARDRADRRRAVAAVIGERGVFGPDPGVDHADHDVLAVDAAVVRAAIGGELEEPWRAVGLRVAPLVLQDPDDALLDLDPVDLGRRQHGRVPVQRERVVVELLGCGHARLLEGTVVVATEQRPIALGGQAPTVDLLAGGRLRRRDAGCAPVVRDDRIGGHDDDVRFRRLRCRDGHGDRGYDE